MSSLLRAESISMLTYQAAGMEQTLPRMFGTRVLRSDSVGLRQPMTLAVPVVNDPGVADLLVEDEELEEQQAAPLPPPPPDFAVLEEAARLHGYNVGFDEGHASGMAAAEAATGESILRLKALLEGVHQTHATFFRAAEREVVELALQIARKVIEREVENMPDMAIGVIRAALEEMDARTAVRVRVNPADEELLRRRWTQVVPSGIGPDRIELLQDEKVLSGGAIIETTHGQVDAQLETKLAQLGNALWTFVMDESAAQDDSDA